MQVKTLDSLAASGVLKDKRVLIRSDLNVPRNDEGAITNDARIVASLPAIKTALLAGAAVMVTSHLGRPKEGVLRPEDSLQVVADRLGELLGREVPVVQDWVDGVEVKPGKLMVLENCRCNVGEKKCDEALSKKYAALCDVYVNDAFGTAHRAEATTVGVAKYAPIACAGPLMAKEIEALSKALGSPSRPLAAIVAGSKVSTKLTILSNLAEKVDRLIVGGGILNILKDLNVGFAQLAVRSASRSLNRIWWTNAARCSRFLKRRVQSCRCPSMSWRPRLLRLMLRTAFAVLMKWPMTR